MAEAIAVPSRRHWIDCDVGVGVQLPTVTVRVSPIAASPLMVGTGVTKVARATAPGATERTVTGV